MGTYYIGTERHVWEEDQIHHEEKGAFRGVSCGGESIDQKPQGSRKDKLMTEGCLGQPSPKTEDDALLTRRSCLQRKLHDDSRGTALGLCLRVPRTKRAGGPHAGSSSPPANSPGVCDQPWRAHSPTVRAHGEDPCAE